MALNDVTLTFSDVLFDTTTGLISITDGSDFVANGVPLADVQGTVTIKSPSGGTVCTQNLLAAEFDYNVSLTNSDSKRIPKDSKGNYERGNYVIDYLVQQISNGATITATFTVDFCGKAPEPKLDWNLSCLCAPLVKAQDNTNYAPSGEEPWTINSRTITIRGPLGQTYATALSTENQINSGSDNCWSGNWAATIVAEIERTVDGVTEVYDISYTVTAIFECVASCNVACILNTLQDRLDAATGTKAITEAQEILNKATAIATLMLYAERCGEGDRMSELATALKKAARMSGNCCGCDSTTPVQITPSCEGTGGDEVEWIGGTKITIVGTTISLAAASSIRLDNTFNTVVAQGAGISVSLVTDNATNPPTRTYIVAIGGNVPTTKPEIWSGTLQVSFEPLGLPYLEIVSENRFDGTTTFQALPWTVGHVAGGVVDPAEIMISDFLVSPNGSDPFTVNIDILDGQITGADMRPVVYDKDVVNGRFKIRFEHSWGFLWDWFSLKGLYTGVVDFSISIHRKI